MSGEFSKSMQLYAAARESVETARSGFPKWATEKRPIFGGAQLWICRACETVRQWGEKAPPVTITGNEDVRLRCLSCKAVTSHMYGGVARGFTDDGDGFHQGQKP